MDNEKNIVKSVVIFFSGVAVGVGACVCKLKNNKFKQDSNTLLKFIIKNSTVSDTSDGIIVEVDPVVVNVLDEKDSVNNKETNKKHGSFSKPFKINDDDIEI